MSTDNALYWFEGLDRDIKQNWSKLQQAIIVSFPWPTTSRSRVKAVLANGLFLGYVGPLARESANIMVTKAEEALILDISKTWDAQQTAARIRLAVPNDSYPFIGLELHSGDIWGFRACNAGEYPSIDRGSLMS
ncbi:hypothetical protein FRB93_014067 [Tulasnella sp. JGI-2019a]|nr:hypothetical protein FRB93_014067 [Tulasnella sp. JGI-2019a]